MELLQNDQNRKIKFIKIMI